MEDRFLKRLRKKARKGLRGWPIATIAFYGPNLSQATKVTVGIVPSENAEVKELRDWKVDRGDIRGHPDIAREILEFIEKHRVLSVAMTDSIIGCPHQQGIGGLTKLPDLIEVGERLFGAEVDLYDKPEDRARVLQRQLDVYTEAEGNLERQVKEGLATQADLERLRYNKASLEIDLLHAKTTVPQHPAPPHNED